MRPSRWSQLSRASSTSPPTENGERKVKPLGELALVRRLLGAQAEDLDAELPEVPGEVAEGAGLGRAAPRSGDEVPVLHERRLARLSGARIGEDDGAAGDGREVDPLAGRPLQWEGRHCKTGQVPGATIVDGDRKPLGNSGEVSRRVLGHGPVL